MREKKSLRILVFSIPLVALLLLSMGNTAYLRAENEGKDGLKAVGQELFVAKGCNGCHTIGQGKLTGPDLKGVGEKRDVEWMTAWIKSPMSMVFTDPIAKELLKEYMVPMPDLGLTDEEVEALVEFLVDQDVKD